MLAVATPGPLSEVEEGELRVGNAHQPAAVVQVGETEVAIDFDIARQIYVRPQTFRGWKSGHT